MEMKKSKSSLSVNIMTNNKENDGQKEKSIEKNDLKTVKIDHQFKNHSKKLEAELQREEKNDEGKSVFKATFAEVFGDSTCHGLPNAIKNECIVLKIFWLILFLGAVGVCAYYVYVTLASYFDFDTVTSVMRTMQTIQTFPAVTICNINPFDMGNSNTTAFYQQVLSSNGLSQTIDPGPDDFAIELVREYMSVLKSSAVSDMRNNSTYIRSLGYDLDTLLISCYFNGFACNSSDFYWYFTYDYGNCYIFNHDYGSGENLKVVSQSGPTSGLQLELFMGLPGKGRYMEQGGLYVSVNTNSQLAMTKFEGLKLMTGQASNIGIEKTYYNRLDGPYSDCRKDVSTYTSSDSIYYKTTLKITKYTQKLCFQICLQYEFIIPTCGCSDASIPAALEASPNVCVSLSQINCATNVTNEFNLVDLSVTCGRYCPLECDTEEFSYSLSSSNYPTTPYYNIVSKQANLGTKFFGTLTQNLYSQSCVLVNIFLSDLYYTEIDESPALTIDGAFGIIGGQLGLYLGASMLTFFEIFDFFGNVIWRYIKINRSKRTVFNSRQEL